MTDDNLSVNNIPDATFASFQVVEQDTIIQLDFTARAIVNAGPGTGKTWTLVERLKYMLEKGVDPERILVLCFTNDALNEIKNRLEEAVYRGDLSFFPAKLEIRTFDSFASRVLRVISMEKPEDLGENYSLGNRNYDERIEDAVDILRKESSIFSECDHIIVDEVQDLVNIRAEMVLAILKVIPEMCGFTLLGDACQAIFDYQIGKGDTFSIDSNEFYNELFHEFRDVLYYAMVKNYRQEDELGGLADSYRKAILTGDSGDRAEEAKKLYDKIGSSEIVLERFTEKQAEEFTKTGTLGILTRSNKETLQISSWLHNNGVKHQVQMPADPGIRDFAGWISDIFFYVKTEVIDEREFLDVFEILYPKSGDIAKKCWKVLIAGNKNENGGHYEIEDLLMGLSRNYSNNSFLFDDPQKEDPPMITVSNIHRAKGHEYDSVLVLDRIISDVVDPNKDNINEHKVCYVAVTRPRKLLERVTFAYASAIKNVGYNNRLCVVKDEYNDLTHIEVKESGDLDIRSFALNSERQDYIRKEVKAGTGLKFLKCPEGTREYIVYKVVPEYNEDMVLGCTTSEFSNGLEKAYQKINSGLSVTTDYKSFPEIIGGIYVDRKTSYISTNGSGIEGARQFGNLYVWSGISVRCFAQIETNCKEAEEIDYV